MLDNGIGRETVRRAMVLLQAMFTLGVEWGEAERNPVSVVRKPRQGRTRAIEVLDPATVERLRRALLADGDHFSATLVSVLAYAGVRPGEGIALERRHIREDTILVEQAVSYGSLKMQKTGRVYRTVDLFPELRADIMAWCDMKHITRPDAPLFGRADGDWMTPDDWKNWRRRRFNATTEAIDLGRPRPYDLRHSFASLMIRDGNTSIVELAEQRTQAAPRVARRRQRLVVDPGRLAIPLPQQTDRLHARRVEREAAHGGLVGQAEVGLAHEQPSGVEDEGQRRGILLRSHQGRERGGRLEHGVSGHRWDFQ